MVTSKKIKQMLHELTNEELQQQLYCAAAGLNITFAPTETEIHEIITERKQRPLIQDEQEDIELVKAWQLAGTEQGI